MHYFHLYLIEEWLKKKDDLDANGQGFDIDDKYCDNNDT